MKKIFYTAAITLCSMALQAQNPSGPDSYYAQDLQGNWANGKFDEWVDISDSEGNVTGVRPKFWNSSPAYNNNIVNFAKAVDRFGEEGKAAKMTIYHTSTWYSWHVSVRVADKIQPDYWPFFLPKDDEFYYTFWAKGEAGGEKLHIGPGALWDPASKLGTTWADMVYAELTTEWRQYGFQLRSKVAAPEVPVEGAQYGISDFAIQPRVKGVYYIDDLVINWGDELPELEEGPASAQTEEFKNIKAYAVGDNNIRIVSDAQVKITLREGLGRTLATYDIQEGETIISTPAQGLYFLEIAKNGQKIDKKILVK